jgi:flavin-dependent dehydrogenase
MTERFSAVVAGGGPAGAAAALTLAREGCRVLLADLSPAGAFRVGESLPPAVCPLLRDLGVLDRFRADEHLASYGNLSVWGSDRIQAHDHIFDPHGHGWHLDRARFDAMLRDAARAAGAEVLEGVEIGKAERDDGHWRLHLRVGEATRELQAAWLIDATGRRATLARRYGATRHHDDRLVAFHARFRSALGGDEDARTMIESAPDGWWYTALLPSRERVVVWLTDADLADRAALLSPEGFAARLRESSHTGALLASRGYILQGRPSGTGAGSARLDPFAGDGWVAVGDAALSFDPLSSQGMLNALYTGLRAGQAIARALAGDHSGVAHYGSRLGQVYAAYLRNRHIFYAGEPRWSGHPFWQRRHSVLKAAGLNGRPSAASPPSTGPLAP